MNEGARPYAIRGTVIDGDPDPISAGIAGDAARWGGSSAAVGMAANPFGAHQSGGDGADGFVGSYLLATRAGRGERQAGCVA